MAKTTPSQRNNTRHEFLLTLFPDNKPKYAVLKMNGFFLVRYIDNSVVPMKMRVAIYPMESWGKKQQLNTP